MMSLIEICTLRVQCKIAARIVRSAGVTASNRELQFSDHDHSCRFC